jgi:chorismate dehydratase
MLRLGAVSYLNTRPLIYGLRERLAGQGRLTLNLPSRLADDLKAGRLDVALIPSIEYLRGEQIVSDAVIACRGPVWSVRLLSRVPLAEIRTLALDEGSRTSATLVRVLLDEAFGIRPETVPLPIDALPEASEADAMLMIGDRAMHPPAGVYQEIWDLGERWCRQTELPFVFAMWVARPGIETEAISEMLAACRDEGQQHLEEIAQREAGPHGLTTSALHRYFAENLHFQLGPRELAGLTLYQQRAAALGAVSSQRDLMRA